MGSATATLYQQLGSPSSVAAVAAITAYLALTAGLKVTMSAAFDAVPANLTTTQSVPVALARPLTSAPTPIQVFPLDSPGGKPIPGGQLHATPEMLLAWGLSPFANAEKGFANLGIHGNVVFGVPDPSNGAGTMDVRGYRARARCMKLGLDQVNQSVIPRTIGMLYVPMILS